MSWFWGITKVSNAMPTSFEEETVEKDKRAFLIQTDEQVNLLLISEMTPKELAQSMPITCAGAENDPKLIGKKMYMLAIFDGGRDFLGSFDKETVEKMLNETSYINILECTYDEVKEKFGNLAPTQKEFRNDRRFAREQLGIGNAFTNYISDLFN